MNLASKYNYYEILEIGPNAPQHEVTTSYERARSTYSSDNPALYTIFSEVEAREWMTLIEEAYSVLGNKTLRALYDERLLTNGAVNREELSYQSLMHASKLNYPEPAKKQVAAKPTYSVDADIENQIKARDSWDGDFIRKVREYKGITQDRMSEITKITSYYINAVEGDDPSNLPAPVFVRGYVVQIAKTLGLDDKKVADSYMKHYKQLVEKSK